ncbi:MAG: hypothetical protein IJ752_01635 [Alphaproteobacteria bacterium]|nr:hypothetical protein [Alphaproteobacteria bacterium]
MQDTIKKFSVKKKCTASVYDSKAYRICSLILSKGNKMGAQDYPFVFRNTLKTATKGKSQKELFEFCKKEKMIGGGWPLARIPKDKEEALALGKNGQTQNAERYGQGFTRALNCLGKMRENDIVWTRCAGLYYICPVLSGWEYLAGEEADIYDMHQIVRVKDFIEVGMAEKVPGKIISSFAPRGCLQRIKDDDFFLSKWSLKILKEVCPDYHDYDHLDLSVISGERIFELLSPKEVEAVICLYLQKELGYFIYTDTVRTDMETYECVLVKNDGSHFAFPQVKTGKVSLEGKAYEHLLKGNDKVYLFSDKGTITDTDNKNIIALDKKEILDFIRKNSPLFPEKITSFL